ncbi:MAG TPA: hypothetical protein VHI11_05775 [Jiangellaceae bacterium]|nr:hypothetical protein [Jiangellaceae bacterium]
MTRDPVFEFLMPVLERARAIGEVPLISSSEWAALPATDLRKSGAVARAALCWHRDGLDDVVRERLRRDLDDDDVLLRFRIRQGGLDVHGRGSTDWGRVYEVVTARVAYRERFGVSA